MKRRMLWALAGLNMLLVVTLAARFAGDNSAVAQVRRPAEYIMIPGEVSGGSSAVVYVVDSSNGMLGALTYDEGRQQLNTMPPIDLSRVFQSGGGSVGGGGAVRPGAVGAPVPGGAGAGAGAGGRVIPVR